MSNYNNNRPDSRDNRNRYPRNNAGFNSNRGNFNRGESNDREMFSAVCDECGRRCELPFKPTRDKPVFCNDCFKKRGIEIEQRPKRFEDRIVARNYSNEIARPDNNNSASIINDKILGQLTSLNAKMEKLVKLFEGKSSSEPVTPKAEVMEEKIIKSKKNPAKKVSKKKIKKEK